MSAAMNNTLESENISDIYMETIKYNSYWKEILLWMIYAHQFVASTGQHVRMTYPDLFMIKKYRITALNVYYVWLKYHQNAISFNGLKKFLNSQ